MKIRQFESRAEHDAWFCYVICSPSTEKFVDIFHTKKSATEKLKELNICAFVSTRKQATKLGYKP